MAQKKYLDLIGLQKFAASLLGKFALKNHNHDSVYAAKSHTHTTAQVTGLDSALSGKANVSHTHTKSQITDFPNIPTKTSELTNDSGFTKTKITVVRW